MDLLNLINNLKHANISPLLETCKALHVTLCTFRISIFKRASKFAKPQDLANFQRKYQQTPKASRSGADFSRINFVQTCNSFSFKSTLSKPTRFTGNVFWVKIFDPQESQNLISLHTLCFYLVLQCNSPPFFYHVFFIV